MTAAQTVRLASPCDKPVIEQMLRAGFGNEEGFLRAFFDHVFPFCDTLLSLDGGIPAAMATLIPCEIVCPGKPHEKALYLYSLTTLPAHRGRGHAKVLLAASKERCSRVILHAADDSLFGMYAALDWQPMMYARFVTLPPAAPQTDYESVTGDEYFYIREMSLKHTPHIRWNKNTCRYLHDTLFAYGGGLYKAQDAVIAVDSMQDGTLYISEAFGSDAPRLAAEIARQAQCTRSCLTVPCPPNAPDAFPMTQGVGEEIPDLLQISFVFQ